MGKAGMVVADVFHEYVRIAALCPSDPCGSRLLTSLSHGYLGTRFVRYMW